MRSTDTLRATSQVTERAERCAADMANIVDRMHPERFLVLPDQSDAKHGAIFLPSDSIAEKYVGYVVARGDDAKVEVMCRVAWLKGHNPFVTVGEWSVRVMAFDDLLFTMKDE